MKPEILDMHKRLQGLYREKMGECWQIIPNGYGG